MTKENQTCEQEKRAGDIFERVIRPTLSAAGESRDVAIDLDSEDFEIDAKSDIFPLVGMGLCEGYEVCVDVVRGGELSISSKRN